MVDIRPTDEPRQSAAAYNRNPGDGTIVAIHQPNYVPWLGYFFKIAHSTKFVFLDMVAYPNGGLVNRNSIKMPCGPAWLTIPVLTSGRSGQLVNKVETDNRRHWAKRHIATLQSAYGRAPYFKEIFTLLEPIYESVSGDRSNLAAFNIAVIRLITDYLEVKTQFITASDLTVSGQKTDLLLDICQAIGASTYLAGSGCKAYQEDAKFEDAGIVAVYSSFSQQSYPQLFGNFIGNLSIVDVLMNCGRLGTRRLLGLDADQVVE